MSLGLKLGLHLASGGGGSTPSVIDTADAWYSAVDGAQGQTIANRNGAGSAELGSTAGVDANDPVWMSHDGTTYVWTPGNTIANRIQTSGVTLSNADVTEIEWRWQDVEITDVFAAPFTIVTVASGTPLFLYVSAGGNITVYHAAGSIALSPATSPLDDEYGKIRIVWDDGSGDHTFEYYNGIAGVDPNDLDAVSWTLQDSGTEPDTGYDAPNGVVSLSTLMGRQSNFETKGKMYRCRYISDGVTEYEFYPDRDYVSGTTVVDDTSSVTWSLLQSGSGLKTAVITRPAWLFDGTNDQITFSSSGTVYCAYAAFNGALTVDTGIIDPTTSGNFEGQLFEITEFASSLSAGDLSDLTDEITAMNYEAAP
jgi:hypothetical protein